MIDSKTPNLTGDVTLIDQPAAVPAPSPAKPNLRAILADGLSAAIGPIWGRIVVAVVLLLAGAIGHKCAQTPPAAITPAPVNVNVQPATSTPSPVGYARDGIPMSKEQALKAFRGCCRESVCCSAACTCPPGECCCPGCAKPGTCIFLSKKLADQLGVRGAAPVDDFAKLTHRQRVVAHHARAKLIERLQRDGLALAGGDPKPLTKDQAEALVSKLTDAQVYGAAHSAGASVEKIGDGGTFLDFFARIMTWIKDHPEVVEMILKILMSLLMFISAETGIPVDVLLAWFVAGDDLTWLL